MQFAMKEAPMNSAPNPADPTEIGAVINPVEIDTFTVDHRRAQVWFGAAVITLEERENRLLHHLSRVAPRFVPPTELADTIGVAHDPTLVSDVIRSLRRALDLADLGHLVVTARGVGFGLAARRVAAPTPQGSITLAADLSGPPAA
jgi:DNA-binding response OmpR family regulator